jgi:hypothetical protein
MIDIEGVSIAVVGVYDERRRHSVAHQRDGVGHLAHGDKADIGPSEACIGNRRAR